MAVDDRADRLVRSFSLTAVKTALGRGTGARKTIVRRGENSGKREKQTKKETEKGAKQNDSQI